MATFELFYDTKESVWYRRNYTVTAETPEEAAEKLRALIESDDRENDDVERGDGDYLLDTTYQLSPEENDGDATEIIYLTPARSIDSPAELWSNEISE